MISDRVLILAMLALTIVLCLWGRWRHDVVALFALLACVLTGLVPQGTAFVGFRLALIAIESMR